MSSQNQNTRPQPEKLSDQDLLKLLDRDPEAGMEAAVEQFTGLLWRIAEKHLKDTEDIKECVNDTFLEFYMHRDRFDQDKGTVTAYLAQIAHNLAISRYRKNVVRSNLSAAHSAENPDLVEASSDLEQLEMQMDLEQAITALKPEDAEIIRMKYYDGMTVREIAASLGLPYDTVKKRHQRSLFKMRRILLSLLVLGLLGLLTACAYKLLQYLGVIPGYVLSNDPEALVFILEEPIQTEGADGICQIRDAMLLGSELYIHVNFYLPSLPVTDQREALAAFAEFSAAGAISSTTEIVLNRAAASGILQSSTTIRFSEKEPVGHYLEIILHLSSVDVKKIPEWEQGIEAKFTLFGTDLSCRLIQAQAEQISEYSYQTGSRGGVLAIPRLEDGHLIVGIYPINIGTQTIFTHLLRGRFMEGKIGDVTVTAPDGQDLVGECLFQTAFGTNYFYDWDFGPAQPGSYTLHVPYLYLNVPVEDPVAFRLDLEQGTWDDQAVLIPGGELSIESCQPLELPIGSSIPGLSGPFTVREDTRLWTLRLRYTHSGDLVMTSCMLTPAAEMEIQNKVLNDVATGPDGSFVPFSFYGFAVSLTGYAQENNILELTIVGWDGCYDPSNVQLTITEPLSMRWEHSFDLPLHVKEAAP